MEGGQRCVWREGGREAATSEPGRESERSGVAKRLRVAERAPSEGGEPAWGFPTIGRSPIP